MSNSLNEPTENTGAVSAEEFINRPKPEFTEEDIQVGINRFYRFKKNKETPLDEARAKIIDGLKRTGRARSKDSMPVKTLVFTYGIARCPHCDHPIKMNLIAWIDTLTPFQRGLVTKRTNQLLKDVEGSKLYHSLASEIAMYEFRLQHEQHTLTARDIKELNSAKIALIDRLEVATPRGRRLSGKKSEETIAEVLNQSKTAVTKSLLADRKIEESELFEQERK